jgi:hypothetical protein
LCFLDSFLPLSRLIIPNPHKKFKLQRRNITFEGDKNNPESLVLKEGISNLRSVCFVLVTLTYDYLICVYFIKEDKMSELFCRFFYFYLYLFPFSLLRIGFGAIPSSKVDECLTKWIFLSGG